MCAALAQLVERLTRNEKVAGSIPAGGSPLPLVFAEVKNPPAWGGLSDNTIPELFRIALDVLTQLCHRGKRVLNVEMRIGLQRDLHIRMTKNLTHRGYWVS